VGSEKLLGAEHPNTLLVVHNLAYHLGCSSQCQYTETETLYRQALAGTENSLGPKHLHTLHQQNHKNISAFSGLLATFLLADKSQQVY